MTKKQDQTVAVLLERYGTTYAQEANIGLKDTPARLYQLLVLSMLLSARINSGIAVAAARELFAAGYRTPGKMVAATWQQRVDALGRGHYRRYDERTSTMLGETAQQLMDQCHGDLRRVRDQAGSTSEVLSKLQEFRGIGPTGASIFCREVQGLWPNLAPHLDKKVIQGADALDLPTSADELAALADADALPRLAAACVRAALDKKVAEDVRNALYPP